MSKRHSLYIGAGAFDLTGRHRYNNFLQMKSRKGRRLYEGDPPEKFPMSYYGLAQHGADSEKIQA
jgi:hypothetical protein